VSISEEKSAEKQAAAPTRKLKNQKFEPAFEASSNAAPPPPNLLFGCLPRSRFFFLLQDELSPVTRIQLLIFSLFLEMARALFPRRRSATPSKAPASAPAGDGNGIGVSAFCPPDAPSSSSAPAPSSLPSTPAPAGSSDRGQASPGASAAASKDRKGKRSSQSNLEIPLTTAPTSSPPSKATVNASLTRLQATVARRQQHARAAAAAPPPSSSPASSSLSSAEIERLWEEDHAVLLAAVEALAGAAGGRGDAPAAAAAAAAALPATPPADRRGRRRPRPPSSGPTPPPPPLPATEKARVAAAAAGEEEGGSDDLTLPVALWLRRHEPLLREAAAAAAEARTFDTEAAILSLCAREGISPEKLAEECAKLSPFSSSSSSSSEGQNFNPLGIDVAVALDRAAELRVALANFDEDARGDAPGFVTAADEDTLRVRYRHIKGTSEHTVRFEATILAPLEHLLALCSEIDLAPRWNRFVVDAAVVARTAVFCSFYYASQWSPRPFPQMDSCVRVRGHDGYDSSARGAVVCLESWPREKAAGAGDDRGDKDPVSLDLPAAAARRHRVLVLPGSCIVLAPIRPCPATGAERTRGILLVTLDPRLPFVPSFLVAWVLRVLAPSIKRGIDAVMASWFSPGEGGEGGFDGAAPGAAAAAAAAPGAAAAARTGRSGGGGGGEAGVEMRRRLVNRPELYDLAKRLVARHAEERGGDLPASPARPVPPARTTAGTGSGGLWRSSSEIPAAAAAAGAALRRRSSTFSAVPASVSAVVDGAIARLSRMSSGGGGGGGGFGGGAAAAAAATAEQQQQPPSSSEEDQGWISWLARPLSATASYASSLLHVERTVPS
jgi:hypothetical protein